MLTLTIIFLCKRLAEQKRYTDTLKRYIAALEQKETSDIELIDAQYKYIEALKNERKQYKGAM